MTTLLLSAAIILFVLFRMENTSCWHSLEMCALLWRRTVTLCVAVALVLPEQTSVSRKKQNFQSGRVKPSVCWLAPKWQHDDARQKAYVDVDASVCCSVNASCDNTGFYARMVEKRSCWRRAPKLANTAHM